jgi:hypothetical protein
MAESFNATGRREPVGAGAGGFAPQDGTLDEPVVEAGSAGCRVGQQFGLFGAPDCAAVHRLTASATKPAGKPRIADHYINYQSHPNLNVYPDTSQTRCELDVANGNAAAEDAP